MGRPKRLWHANGYYHVTIRGNNRQNIFLEMNDMREYLRYLTYVYSKHPFEVYAFCIMNNHNHLLLRSQDVPLSKIMAIVNKRYSDFCREKYNYTGQIYENRYFSKEVSAPTGLVNVSAYIHQNPIETKVPIVKAMEDYPYSSYYYYHYNIPSPYPFLNLNLLPSLMSHAETHKRQAYLEYCINYQP